jgi:calmodulin/calcium-binding protein CML/plastin-2
MNRKADVATPVQERQAELREDFEYFDDDGDGLLQFSEFVSFLDGLGADMSTNECRVGFAEIDSDQDGMIEYDEFLNWWTSP